MIQLTITLVIKEQEYLSGKQSTVEENDMTLKKFSQSPVTHKKKIVWKVQTVSDVN